MGNPASQGSPFRPSAHEWNSFREAAHWVAMQKTNPTDASRGSHHPPGIVLVKNESETDVDRNGVLGISGSMHNPASALAGFREPIPFLKGVVPTSSHTGRFVVTLEAIPAGQTGYAIAQGVVAVKVNVTNSAIKRCDVKASDATQLETSLTGSARILTIASGTGTKWAIVSLGTSPGVIRTFCGNMSAGVSVTGDTFTTLPLQEWMKTDAGFYINSGAVVLPYDGIYLCHYKVIASNSTAAAANRLAAYTFAALNGSFITCSNAISDWTFPTTDVKKSVTLAASFCFNAPAGAELSLKGYSAPSLGPIGFVGGANGSMLTVQYQGPWVV